MIEANAGGFKRIDNEIDWTDREWARQQAREYRAVLAGEDSQINPERCAQEPVAARPSRGLDDPRASLDDVRLYLIHEDQAVIFDVEATPTRISKETVAAEIKPERREDRFVLKPKGLVPHVA